MSFESTASSHRTDSTFHLYLENNNMNRMTLLLALASVVSGCKPDMPYLTHVEEIARSSKCPGGGAVITTGRDWSHDRVLDEREVLERTEICNGLVRDNDGGVVTVNSGRNGLNALISTATSLWAIPDAPTAAFKSVRALTSPPMAGAATAFLNRAKYKAFMWSATALLPHSRDRLMNPLAPWVIRRFLRMGVTAPARSAPREATEESSRSRWAVPSAAI